MNQTSSRCESWSRIPANIRSALRVDDALIFAWLAIVQPLTIGSHTHAISELGNESVPTGIAYLVAAGFAVLCLASRNPDEPTLAWTRASSPHSYAPLPFVIGIALLLAYGLQDIGAVAADAAFLPALMLALGAFVLYSHLPTLPGAFRRISVMPMAVVASALLNGLMFEMFSGLDRATLAAASVGIVLLVALFSGGFYLFFIFAPA